MPDPYAHPQDAATGATDAADWNDAGGFAFHEDSINERDYVLAGLTFSVNLTTNTLNIAGGKAKLYQPQTQTNDHSNDGGPPAKVLEHALFTVQADSSGDIGLPDNDISHVFIGLNQSENDDYLYQVNTDNTPPSEPYLKLGTVDTSKQTADEAITHLNRAPPGEFRELMVR